MFVPPQRLFPTPFRFAMNGGDHHCTHPRKCDLSFPNFVYMWSVQIDETGTRHFRGVPAFHNLHNVEPLIFCQLVWFCTQSALCLFANTFKDDLCSVPCLSPDIISRSAHLGSSIHFTESATVPHCLARAANDNGGLRLNNFSDSGNCLFVFFEHLFCILYSPLQ